LGRFLVTYIYCKSRAKTAIWESFFAFSMILATCEALASSQSFKSRNYCRVVDISCIALRRAFRGFGVQSLHTAT
jgi:hypothetical protein